MKLSVLHVPVKFVDMQYGTDVQDGYIILDGRYCMHHGACLRLFCLII